MIDISVAYIDHNAHVRVQACQWVSPHLDVGNKINFLPICVIMCHFLNKFPLFVWFFFRTFYFKALFPDCATVKNWFFFCIVIVIVLYHFPVAQKSQFSLISTQSQLKEIQMELFIFFFFHISYIKSTF